MSSKRKTRIDHWTRQNGHFMKQQRILAIASHGGHWQQLMRVRESFEGSRVVYACTTSEHAGSLDEDGYFVIRDYSQDQPVKLLFGLVEAFRIVRRVRPDVALSTGAAPGISFLFWAKIFGAKTIWIDSIANSEKLSLSGKIALRFCTTVLTQWEHLASDGRPAYKGSVI